MVLHNNKWDRRAKQKYLKKHGISTAPGAAASRSNEAGPEAAAPEHSALTNAAGLTETEHEEGANSSSDNEQGEVHASEGVPVPLPELDELDPKLQQLFLQKNAKAATAARRKPTEKDHVIDVADASEIQRAAAGVERSKMNKAVRERFGSSVATKLRNNQLDLDSDSDFDQFMDELDDAEGAARGRGVPTDEEEDGGAAMSPPSVEINKDKQDFLDRLIR